MFTQFLYEMDQPEPSPEQPKIQVATPKQVEQFGNSPVRGVKPQNVHQHIEKGINNNLLDKNFNMSKFERDLGRNSMTLSQGEDYLGQEYAGHSDEMRKALRKAPPKGDSEDRKQWEKEKEAWTDKYFRNDTGENYYSDDRYSPISKNLRYKLEQMDDDNDEYWYKYSQEGYEAVNDYLRYGNIDKHHMDSLFNGLDEMSHYGADYEWDKDEEMKYGLENIEDEDELRETMKSIMHNFIQEMYEQGDNPNNAFSQRVFRGLKNNPFENLQPGQIITDPGFMSTSSDRYYVTRSHHFNKRDGAIMDINAKNPIYEYDFLKTPHEFDESEIVFPPNTPLKFMGRDTESGHYMFNQVGTEGDTVREETKDLKESKKQINKNKSSFQDRMNDFHFEVMSPKKYSDFKQQLDHDD
jgi:hypothetical protein